MSKDIQKNTLTKCERLHSKKKIQELFQKGSSFYLHPFRIKYFLEEVNEGDDTALPQILISVPKRNFKHAVARNLIKRRIREAYRQNKHSLIESSRAQKMNIHIAFIYTAKEKLSFHFIEKQLILGLERLVSSEEEN
ncbi:MAG: ribonuclease P protein component [Cytophagales bacterium]|nr:ribonuclease P protein component [Cytophagales bacterium]